MTVRPLRDRGPLTAAKAIDQPGGEKHAPARVSALVKRFLSPSESLGDFDAEATATLLTAAADVALVLDRDGIIRDVAFGDGELAAAFGTAWIGRSWADTVTPESRGKVADLIATAGSQASPRWRQINHPLVSPAPVDGSPGELDVPVLYCAVSPAPGRHVIAIGRDLRAVATLQQRLVNAQQSLERDYARLRHAETRYRVLFQLASEAVLIVEAATGRIREGNPAATELLGLAAKRVVGRSVPELFEESAADAVRGLLVAARRTGRADEVLARAQGGPEFRVSASLFRQENAAFFLVRLVPVAGHPDGEGQRRAQARLLDVVENLPDGLVVTDPDLKVMMANAAFLDLAQVATEEQAREAALGRWLGRSAVDLNVLIASLREHGTVRHFGTLVQGEHGSLSEVEVSAVAVLDGERPCFGFTIRHVGRRLPAAPEPRRQLPRSVEQLTELVGRVPLKDLIRETTDVIERLCIESALELTDDNRASAAEMLGLSRQSLYVKLRRYGLGDLDEADEGA